MARSPLSVRRGFTIIEILVVMAIMAGFFSIVANVFQSSFQSESRRFGRQLQGVIKYYYNQAILNGTTYRLVVAFSQEEGVQPPITVEMAEGPFVRAATKAGDDAGAPAVTAEPPPPETTESGEDTDMAGTVPKPPPMPTLVSPTRTSFTPVAGGIGASTKIPKRVLLRRVCLPGRERPMEEGTIELYFYPNGSMDAATLVFGNRDESKLLVLTTHPLTGQTDVRRALPREGSCAE